MELDDDEDEETLQLKLQAIQARLKLKKLQAAKAQRKAAAAAAAAASEPGPGDQGGMREVPLQSKLAAARDRMDRLASQNSVQVPASPVRRSQPASDLQTSPQRVLLGIDKGLKGADVSLRRAPSQRRTSDGRQSQQGGYLRREITPLGGQVQQDAARPLSFNERIASARAEEIARNERRERVQRLRSSAFSVGRQEMEEYKRKALDVPDVPSKPEEFSRDQVLSAMGRSSGTRLQRSNTVPGSRSGTQLGDSSNTPGAANSDGNADSGAGFEPYSGLHLSKRILPHTVLARAISGKTPYVLKDLLRKVKAPDWCLPDDETDIVVFAIVASKSDPRSHRPVPGSDGKPQQDRGKYMVLTLVDLTYEVELFLFNSGFDRFWKLTPGTVLAILNPGILPPPPGREATNRFGLVINSDEDTILEIGNARDLGYCKSIKKDGTYCKNWVNARRTEYCEFHTNEAVRKARSARIELSSTAGFGFGGGDGPLGRNRSRLAFSTLDEERVLGSYDRATQSQYFVSTAHRAADPDDERQTGIAGRREREEALKRRLAQREKERDIARRLGEVGGGAGKEYMSRAAARPPARISTTGLPLGSSFSSAAASSSFSSAAPGPSVSTSASSFNTSLSTSFTIPSSNAEPHSQSHSQSQPQLQPQSQSQPQLQSTQHHPHLHSLPNLPHLQQQTTAGAAPRRLDARALGLVGRRATDQTIELGRAPGQSKRKRPESAASSGSTIGGVAPTGATTTTTSGEEATAATTATAETTATATAAATTTTTTAAAAAPATPKAKSGAGERARAALGWGSLLKEKLARMREGERLDGRKATDAGGGGNSRSNGTGKSESSAGGVARGDQSPVRKKTRFVTEKGIREAGRDSLGEPLSAGTKSRRRVVLVDCDDDDDLIIVR